MHDPGYELPRIPIPRTSVNKPLFRVLSTLTGLSQRLAVLPEDHHAQSFASAPAGATHQPRAALPDLMCTGARLLAVLRESSAKEVVEASDVSQMPPDTL